MTGKVVRTMTTDDIATWAKQVFGSVLEDMTDQAISELNEIDVNDVWWISEKAERLMQLAKRNVEAREC